MNVLVLGGTGFLGPDTVQPLVDAGHTVTLFNRGKTNASLFPDLEKLIGDRDTDLTALEGRTWDVVIDIPATLPKWVKATCELLKGKARQYVFVSTISVFDDYSAIGINEDGSVYEAGPDLDSATVISNPMYGPMKTRCEQIVRENFGDGATVVRPGLIVGPDDPTDRFTYWPLRMARGGDVLAPAGPDGHGSSAVQYIDSRDLGAFIAKLVTDGHAGTYNATGPNNGMTMAGLLHGSHATTTSKATIHWVDDAWIVERGVAPFMELPLWVPGPEMAGFMKIDCSKAVAHGLTTRPLAETARDTIAWAKKRPDTYVMRAGLKAEKEAELIVAWIGR